MRRRRRRTHGAGCVCNLPYSPLSVLPFPAMETSELAGSISSLSLPLSAKVFPSSSLSLSLAQPAAGAATAAKLFLVSCLPACLPSSSVRSLSTSCCNVCVWRRPQIQRQNIMLRAGCWSYVHSLHRPSERTLRRKEGSNERNKANGTGSSPGLRVEWAQLLRRTAVFDSDREDQPGKCGSEPESNNGLNGMASRPRSVQTRSGRDDGVFVYANPAELRSSIIERASECRKIRMLDRP